MEKLTKRTFIPFSQSEVLNQVADATKILRWVLSSPEVEFIEEEKINELQSSIAFKVTFYGPMRFNWKLRAYLAPGVLYGGSLQNGALYRIRQEKGVMRRFEYYSKIIPRNDGIEIEDEVDFELKFGWFFKSYRVHKVKKLILQMIDRKNRLLTEELTLKKRYPSSKKLRILMTGATGFIGSYIRSMLTSLGHLVVNTTHDPKKVKEDTLFFDHRTGSSSRDQFEGFDAVINLAGASLSDGRWTDKRKANLYASRVLFTQRLIKLFLTLERPPKTFISTSAIGFYGPNVGYADELSPKGEGFIADLAEDWEKAAKLLGCRETRICIMRLGVVIDESGGIVKKMKRLVKSRFLALVGTGDRQCSWISLSDVMGLYYSVLMDSSLSGVFNCTTSKSVPQKKLVSALKRLYCDTKDSRLPPPIPSFFLKLLFGKEMANELLLTSQIVVSQRLKEIGYLFHHQDVDSLFNQK